MKLYNLFTYLKFTIEKMVKKGFVDKLEFKSLFKGRRLGIWHKSGEEAGEIKSNTVKRYRA